MKRNVGKMIAIAFAVLVFAAAASAQSSVTATVPFEFQVNGHQMEAGNYIIDVDAGNKVVLHPADGGATILLSNSAGPNDGSRPASCLVFSRYGDAMYLTQVWSAKTDEGRSIPIDKKNAQLAQKGTETIIAAK